MATNRLTNAELKVLAIEMASVMPPVSDEASDPVSRNSFEDEPYERIATRLNGIQAIRVLAVAELEHDNISPRVWSDLWHFVGKVADDIQQDAELLMLRKHY